MSDEFQWVMDVLGDDCPGNGMNIIKFHHIMAAVSQIRRFGCVMNADTGIYERLMKFIKSLDERVGRSRDDNGNEECFVRSSVTEADRADQLIIDSTKPASSSSPSSSSSSSGPSTCEPGKRTKSGNYFIVGSGHAWSSLVNSLVQGSAGPALSDTVIEGALGTLRNRVVDMSTNFFFFAAQVLYAETNYIDEETSSRILLPGHCVELTSENQFAQVVLIDVVPGASRTGPIQLLVCIVSS
jgi:hypothetical protein